MQGPGSIRIEVTERQLPNGEFVRFVYTKEVWVDDSGMSHIQEKLKIPETTCGCSPSGVHDIRSCAICKGEF